MLLRRGTTLATTFAVLLFAGCTAQEPEPEPPVVSQAPTATADPPQESPSPTPTEAPVAAPAPPAELERTDEVGAAAAAEYFLELYGYVMQTGDVAAWEKMSSESCQFCARTRDLATSIQRQNETFTGSQITVETTFVHPRDELVDGYPVDITFSQAASEHRGPEGAPINLSSPDSGILGVDMKRFEDGWRVLAVTAQDET